MLTFFFPFVTIEERRKRIRIMGSGETGEEKKDLPVIWPIANYFQSLFVIISRTKIQLSA